MEANKFLPRSRLLAVWSAWKAPALENIAYGLIADVVAQLGESTGNAVITPGTILLGHVDDQVFEFPVDTRSSHGLSLRGAIEFLSHQLAMPGENRLGFDDGSDFLQRLLAEFLADLGQGLALGVGKLDPPCNVVAQNPILFDHVCVAQQELFLHRTGDTGQ
jgi:hypothetical protein